MIRALLMELQRWNNSRAIVCRHCGLRLRPRAGIAARVAENHRLAFPAHVVKVKRFG